MTGLGEDGSEIAVINIVMLCLPSPIKTVRLWYHVSKNYQRDAQASQCNVRLEGEHVEGPSLVVQLLWHW